jgi:hypothetical protein
MNSFNEIITILVLMIIILYISKNFVRHEYFKNSDFDNFRLHNLRNIPQMPPKLSEEFIKKTKGGLRKCKRIPKSNDGIKNGIGDNGNDKTTLTSDKNGGKMSIEEFNKLLKKYKSMRPPGRLPYFHPEYEWYMPPIVSNNN